MSTDLTTTNVIVQSEGEKVGQQVHTQISSADLSNGIISVWNIDSKGRPTSWRIHNERQQISSTHFTIQLIQIPDDTQEMTIYAEDPLTGEYKELHQVYGIEDLANPDCYYVHYANGIVNFSSNLSGYNVVSSYYGKGVMYISDARIFHNRAGVVVDTLDNILNRAEDGLRLVEEAGGLAQALKEIEEKTEEGIEVIGQIEDTIHSAQMFGCMVDFTKQSFVLKGEKDADDNFRVNAKELSSVYAQLVAYKGGEPMVGLEVVVEDGNDKDVNGKLNVYQDNCSISIKDGVLSLHSIADPTLGRAMARVRIDIPKSQLYVQGDSSGVLSIYKDFEFAIIMDGEDLYNLEMSNPVYSFNGNYDGFIYETQEVEIDFTLTKANVNVDISNLTWQTSSNSALVVQKISNNKVRIIAQKDIDKDKPTVPQNGLIIFNATGRGVTLSKNFVYTVTRDGKSASMLFLTGEQVFLYNNHTCTGYPNKTSLTLTAILQNFVGLATVDWYFLDSNNIQTELIDGVNCSISDDSLSCDIYCWDFDEEYTTVPSQELNPWQGRRSVVIRAMVSGAIYDEITLYKMGTGTSGEDSFNVILTNESTTVTLNNSMSLIDNIANIFTDILCYHGSTKLDPNEVQFTIAETHECAIKNNGVFIAPNGEARIQLSDIIEDPEEIETSDDCLSFENGDCFELEDDFGDNGFDFDQDHTNDFEVEETTIYSVVTNDTSYVDFDVIYKGFTVRKRFTISKAIQGANGDTGDKGDSLYLNVLGGTRTITYSQVNTKPRPEYSSTFTAELYNNGVLVDNDLVSYTWKANGHVQGSGYGTYFTPTISPTMDEAIGTNEVIVEATCKTTARINGEFKTVYQTLHYYVPVVVTRDANGLDWVNEWEGTKTLIQDHAVFTPKIFAGSKDEQGRITGVAMGCDFLNDQSSNGLAGYQNDEVSFLLDTDGSLMVGNPFKNDGLGLYYSDGRFTLNVSQMSIVGKDVMTEDNIGNALSGAIQGVKDEFTQEIDDLQEQIDSIDTAIEDALGDGYLSIQDKATVKAVFDTLTVEKDSINKQVEKILANQHLTNEVIIDKVTSNLNAYNQSFDTLSVAVNAILSIESGQVPPSMIQAFDSALADFSSSTEEIEDIINEALININQQYSNEILANAKEEIQQEVDDLDGALSNLETTMNGEFKSGLISQAKIKALLEHVEIINDEMADITVQYEGMVASTNLNSSKKTKLTELHGALTIANATLQASIESSIPDYLFTEQEISQIKTNITNYNKALQNYNVFAQECNADIALNIAQGAVDAITDEEMFNKVTNHGIKQGLFIEDGDLYINGQYIQTYNLKTVRKSDGATTFYIDSDGNVEITPTKFTITTGTETNLATKEELNAIQQNLGYSVVLTNELQIIPTDTNLYPLESREYSTTVQVYKGTTPVDFTVGTVSSANGMEVSQSGNTITIKTSKTSKLATQSGLFIIPVTTNNITLNKSFSWVASVQDEVNNVKSCRIVSNGQLFTPQNKTYSPSSITLTPILQFVEFSKWQYNATGTTHDVVSGQNGLTINNNNQLIVSSTSALFNSSDSVTFTVITDSADIYDAYTIARLEDGKDGLTIVLTNETQSFATDNQGKVLSNQTYTSDILVYRGSTPYEFTNSLSTTTVNNITVKKVTDSQVSFSVTKDDVIGVDGGTFEIPIVVDGVTYNKTFSWTLAKAGEKGDRGEAISLDLVASSQTIRSNDGGITFSPSQITLNAICQNTTCSTWQVSTNGGASFSTLSSYDGSQSITVTLNDFDSRNVDTLVYKAIGSTTSVYDTITLQRLIDVSDINVGSVNLLNNSNFDLNYPTNVVNWSVMDGTVENGGGSCGSNCIYYNNTGSNNYDILRYPLHKTDGSMDTVIEKGQWYTLSFYVKSGLATSVQMSTFVYSSVIDTNAKCLVDGEIQSPRSDGFGQWSLTTEWVRHSYTFKTNTTFEANNQYMQFRVYPNSSVYICRPKLEKGVVATDWNYSPQDMTGYIDNTLTTLLERNNEIIEDINRMASDNFISELERADFKYNYDLLQKQHNVLHSTLTSMEVSYLDGLASQLQNAWSNVEKIAKPIIESGQDQGATNIRAVFLAYYDAYNNALYGMDTYTKDELTSITTKLSQHDTDITMSVTRSLQALDKTNELGKHMRFSIEGWLELYSTVNGEEGTFKTVLSNEKLAFYENNSEVAYISNNKLNINNAVINHELQVGKVTITKSGSDGVVFRFEE